MKKDDVKVGLWIQSAASTAPLRVVWFDDKGLLCASRDDQSRYWLYAEQLPHIGLFDPAELTAAGVPDSLRLVEQRSEWEGVTFKSLTDKYHPQNLVSVHIDNSHAFYARATNDFLEIGTPRLYSYQFDVTGQCDPLRARPDVLQAVVKFRSERREAGLKWNLGDGWIYRVKAGRAEGWMNESKMWRPIAGPPDSSARVIMNCSDATPEQIAQSGCPIADVPESMKIEVERLRGAKTLKCGLTVRVGDLVSTEPTAVMRDYIFRVFSLDTGNDEHAAKIERWDEGKKGWHRSAYVIYMDRVWQHSSPEKIAATTIPTTDIPDPALREAVEKIRAGKATEEIWECECCGAHHALFKPANCMHCTCPRLKNIGKHNCKLSPSPAATRTAFDAETWPVNAWIRHEDYPRDKAAIVFTDDDGVGIAIDEEGEKSWFSWSELASERWEFSIDCRSWHACIRESLASLGGSEKSSEQKSERNAQ